MNLEESLDILKQGMQTELWGQRFYREAVARTDSEAGKHVFQSLVDEEGKHLDILRGEYASLQQDGGWLSPEEAMQMAESAPSTGIFPEAAEAEHLIPDDASDVRALELAMDFERRGYEQYKANADAAESPEARELWQSLAKWEDAHYAFLQKTHEFLQTDGAWYFDEEELPFFEG
jgi:rubrerythrin